MHCWSVRHPNEAVIKPHIEWEVGRWVRTKKQTVIRQHAGQPVGKPRRVGLDNHARPRWWVSVAGPAGRSIGRGSGVRGGGGGSAGAPADGEGLAVEEDVEGPEGRDRVDES